MFDEHLYDSEEYRGGNPRYRILELEPGHFEYAACTLCGAQGEHVDWYWAFSPESFRTANAIEYALEQIQDRSGDLDLHIVAETIAEEVDPIASRNQDELTICPDCVKADPYQLRQRIRRHADQLDEAGYWAPYGPQSDDLADPDLRDQGLWVRRHIGYELVLMESRCNA